MANAVLIQNPKSIYKDEPGVRYHFPKMYRARMDECVGDWVIFYEGKSGALGYTAVQKVREVLPDPDAADHFYAILERDTLWEFERTVGRNDPMGMAWETRLRGADGRAMSGGHAVSAGRRITFEEFTRIVQAGLQPLEGRDALPRDADPPGGPAKVDGFAEAHAPFDYPGLADLRETILISPSGSLHLPENPRHHPHPEYLGYHRENIFGATA